ncbi:hypothetical protein [Nodosilinea sp. E11]|uniref:hypothetical protein n=1 Tax=Nodosilinea sp. E11 TaxID=3037479 RepID=UPI002934990F|nr:hypothetical protein [Nodosilinea sp. E11]WOD38912.1 hypothetical protein RRF56_22155 [Nodosilinea sp. E11]
MTSPSLLEQAKDGDAGAIAALLSNSLRSKGITVRAERESYTLHLWFTASPAPAQAPTVAYARRVIERLQVSSLGILSFYGEQTGFAQPAWHEEIALLSLDTTSCSTDSFSPPPGLAAKAPEPETPRPETPGSFPPPLIPSCTANPAVVSRAYQELGLAPGEPMAQVEAVYFKRRAELLKRGDRAALEPLKWAFTTLKTHLEQAAAPAVFSDGSAINVPTLEQGTVGRSQPTLYQARPQARPQAAPRDDTDVLSFSNRYSNGLIFPALMVLGMLMNAMPIVNGLLYGIKIWMHEFGHATIAWLAGRQALPLPIGWTTISLQRSLFVYFGILTLLGLLFWVGRREAKHWPVILALVLIVVQFYMTWLIPRDTFDMLFSFGGIGGEIYLSALLMVGFFFPLPDCFRWDFYRFPVVLGAAFCFWGQVWLWGQIRQGKASIPFGSMWGDVDHGDMNQLVNYHNWTPGDIIGTYSAIAHLCLFAIIAVYGYTLFRQHRETFVALGRQWLP